MKLKESKDQALKFYVATSGMDKIEFPGIKSPSDFWNISEEKVIKKSEKYAAEEDVNAVVNMFGGF